VSLAQRGEDVFALGVGQGDGGGVRVSRRAAIF
jgi:hypothetical protein